MEVANTLEYYITATIMAVKSFIEQAPYFWIPRSPVRIQLPRGSGRNWDRMKLFLNQNNLFFSIVRLRVSLCALDFYMERSHILNVFKWGIPYCIV